MYKVYCDSHLLYADSLNDYKIVSPKLELELNKAGKFEFLIYRNHPTYGLIEKLKSIITVYQDNNLIFRGRILNSEKGWRNEQKITCEGELAFLNDSVIRPYDYISKGQITIADFFKFFIDNHNSQMIDNPEKQFKVGVVNVMDGDKTNTNNLISRANSDYSVTWEELNEKLLKPLGGYLIVRHEADGTYIDYKSTIDLISNQTIEFGKNLLDVSLTVKGEDLYTAIIPLGAKLEGTEERLNIKTVNNGIDYIVNTEQARRFGTIFKTVVWDDVKTPQNLLNKANELITSIGALTETIELNAVDISPLTVDANSFQLGTQVVVKSKYHDINSLFAIEKLTIDLMKPESNKLTLGATRKSFTEQSSSNSSDIASITQKVDTAITQMGNIEVDITTKVASDIEISAESILQSVSEEFYTKGQTNALIDQTQTTFEQSKDEFNFRFNTFEANLNDVSAGANAQFDELRKYIRFVNGNIILGQEGNELTLKIQNNRISFLENDIEVAYVSNKKLYIKDGTFINSMSIGNFGFFPRANGNLSLKKVGE